MDYIHKEFQLNKQCDTQRPFHMGLILEELLTRVGPLYMLTNQGISQTASPLFARVKFVQVSQGLS